MKWFINILLRGLIGITLFRQRLSAAKRKRQANPETPNPQNTMSKEELAQEIERLDTIVQQHTLNSIHITPLPKPPSTTWQSRFGGTPYWPKDMAYPHAPDGKPLHLLAQINFAEMPPLPDYPTSGILQFFIANDDLMGLKFASKNEDGIEVVTRQDTFKVIYHENVVEDNNALRQSFVALNEDAPFPLHSCYSLHFEHAKDPIAPTDYRFEKLEIDNLDSNDELFDYAYEAYSAEGSKIAGYANFTQDDPRSYIGSETDEPWILLFQMDTSYAKEVDIMWGDCGVGNFFIQRSRLLAKDFSRVLYNWDCC